MCTEILLKSSTNYSSYMSRWHVYTPSPLSLFQQVSTCFWNFGASRMVHPTVDHCLKRKSRRRVQLPQTLEMRAAHTITKPWTQAPCHLPHHPPAVPWLGVWHRCSCFQTHTPPVAHPHQGLRPESFWVFHCTGMICWQWMLWMVCTVNGCRCSPTLNTCTYTCWT